MAHLIERLAWDSTFFGVPIARADLNDATAERLRAIDAEARAEGIACLYGTLEPTAERTAHVVQACGHRLVQVALTFDRPSIPFTPTPGSAKVRRGTCDDLPALEPAIRTLTPWSRFAADPRFGLDAARRMYEAWIERAARDTDERALHVSYDDTGITGVTTFVRSPVPRLDLISVARPHTGAGDALIAALFEWAGRIPVEAGPAAARNVAALRFYERCGFRVCRSRYLFHRWLDEEI